MITAYYNENDPYLADALRQLIRDGVITDGEVDDRSISDVDSGDVRGFTRAHFFAGIGLWDEALNIAGWGDEPVWTGSCPCQPFSGAGKRQGQRDERHLWPDWRRLISESGADAVFGEQVPGAVGFGWLDGVSAELEREGYAVGSQVLGAHSVGAPHIRQRVWFSAIRFSDAEWYGSERRDSGQSGEGFGEDSFRPRGESGRRGGDRLSDNSSASKREGFGSRAGFCGEPPVSRLVSGNRRDSDVAGGPSDSGGERRREVSRGTPSYEGSNGWGPEGNYLSICHGKDGGPRDSNDTGSQGHRQSGERRSERLARAAGQDPWGDWQLQPYQDGKYRRLPVPESGVFPLAYGLPRGMGAFDAGQRRLVEVAGLDGASLKRAKTYRIASLRAYGNCINPWVAALHIRGTMEWVALSRGVGAPLNLDPDVLSLLL